MTIFATSMLSCMEKTHSNRAITQTYRLQNMNLQTFKQLLADSSRKEKVFQQFTDKYKVRFKTITDTVFANKRYRLNGIDTERYFYDGFLEFVENHLKGKDDNVIFEAWVHDMAREKALAARHAANKDLIKDLTQKGGVDNWSTAYEMIFEEYEDIFKNVTNRYFADSKYRGRKEDIKYIIHSLFYGYRCESGANGTPIRNYRSWLFIALRNYVNNKKNRDCIDDELGVGHYDIMPANLKSGDDNEEEGFDMSDGGTSSDTPSQGAPSGKEGDPQFIDTIQNAPKKSVADAGETDVEDEPQDDTWAREKMQKILGQITNPTYAEIIRLRIMEKNPWTHEEIAEELDIPMDQIYNRVNRAMVCLTEAALPFIRRKLGRLLEYHAAELKSSKMREMAEDYVEGQPVEEIAKKYHMSNPDTSEMLAKAYRELQKINKRNPIEFSTEES